MWFSKKIITLKSNNLKETKLKMNFNFVLLHVILKLNALNPLPFNKGLTVS